MLTTVLDLVGALLIAATLAFLVWPPLALVAAGAVCLLASFLIQRRREGES